jgi:hypothetical protein
MSLAALKVPDTAAHHAASPARRPFVRLLRTPLPAPETPRLLQKEEACCDSATD